MPRKLEDFYPPIREDGIVTDTVIKSKSSTALTAGGVLALSFGASGQGIYVGSGVPTVSAPQGSLYIRSDGSTTATRLYVNTTGSTTWTNVTTAA